MVIDSDRVAAFMKDFYETQGGHGSPARRHAQQGALQ
jgi:hypothetical protein